MADLRHTLCGKSVRCTPTRSITCDGEDVFLGAEPTANAVIDFFEANPLASVELTSGWFGRPHDTLMSLSSAGVAGEHVRLILDGRHVLSFLPGTVEMSRLRLRLAVADVRWQWLPYGRSDIRDENQPDGTIVFHGQEPLA